jgi:2-amino-4-hydroxy-6-hydroxymethyldihydropteridine diphosphokinase
MESILKHRQAFVALGSNQLSAAGQPAQTLLAALKELGATKNGGVLIQAVSRFYRTPAYPLGSGPEFINVVISLTTNLSAMALLERLHEIEADFGRTRQTRWAARTLDLDLIAYEDMLLPDRETLCYWIRLSPQDQSRLTPDQLLLPHPRLQDRAFVLIPLCEFAADWRHPLTGQTVRAMVAALPEAAKAQIQLI